MWKRSIWQQRHKACWCVRNEDLSCFWPHPHQHTSTVTSFQGFVDHLHAAFFSPLWACSAYTALCNSGHENPGSLYTHGVNWPLLYNGERKRGQEVYKAGIPVGAKVSVYIKWAWYLVVISITCFCYVTSEMCRGVQQDREYNLSLGFWIKA